MSKGKKDRLCEDVLAALANGLSVSAASRKFKVSRASIYVWKDQVAKKPIKILCGDPSHQNFNKTIDSLAAEYEDLLALAREELTANQKIITQLKTILSNSLQEFTKVGPESNHKVWGVKNDLS